ncbi:MAG TPA: site-specific integrase [Terracidiphilus sp.]|nr:site-specific integrase [Terracidiphilus sp.]
MGLFKKAGSKNWYYDFIYRGVRYQRSSDTTSKQLAQKAMDQRRRELIEGVHHILKERKPVMFIKASTDWLEINKARWSPNQHRIESYNLKHLTPHFGKMLLTDISGDDVGRYQTKRKDESAAPKTINLETASLRAIMRKHRLWANIQLDTRMLKTSEGVGRALSDDEQHRLLVACKANRSRGLYPAFLVSLRTGLRSGELLNLQWRNVDLVNGCITVGKSKTQAGEGRIVPLP